MICQKCKLDFPEIEIQVSHDVPRYMGGTDRDGRHNLCKKCHDIYERIVFSIVVNSVQDKKDFMCEVARKFAKRYFNDTNT